MLSKSGKILAAFESSANKAVREWRVPGMAVAVVTDDRLIYARGFGIKRLGHTSPVNEHTVFQIGSVSKSFTAALVAMLVDRGKITWWDTVKSHLPDFRLADPTACDDLRIIDLLSHRSGLPAHAGRLLPYLGFDRSYILKKLGCIKPAAGFRREYAYQNNTYLLAAALVEKYSGLSWEKCLHQRILQPLGMSATSASLQGYRRSLNAACGHYYDGPGPIGQVTPLPPDWPYHHWVYTAGPAGGINSNLLDMSRWVKLHLQRGSFHGTRLLSRESAGFMHTPKIAAGLGVWGETRHYCLGWLYSDYKPYPILWHNGGTSGMKSIVAMVPEKDIGMIVLCNLYDALVPEALAATFFDLWFDNPPRDWSRELLEKRQNELHCLQESTAPYTPPRPLRYYTGLYNNALYGQAAVVKTANSLAIILGPGKIRLKLKHWGGDTFALYWPGVLTNGAGVQFSANRSGRVDTICIEGMNDDLTGVFSRIRLHLTKVP